MLLYLVSCAFASSGALDLSRLEINESHALRQRSEGILAQPLYRQSYNFYMDIDIGTPPQTLHLPLSTSFGDVTVLTPSTDLCEIGFCTRASVFNPDKSSSFEWDPYDTYENNKNGKFIDGVLVQDHFAIGDTALSQKLEFAVIDSATDLTNTYIGLGLDISEASFQNGDISEPYANLPVVLRTSGAISHTGFSIWLNSADESEGSIVFGGYDKSHVDGDIYRFPMVPSLDLKKDYAIKLDGASLITPDGNRQKFLYSSLPMRLSPEKYGSYLPYEALTSLYSALGATDVESTGIYTVPCDRIENGGGISLHFSGVVFDFSFKDIMVRDTYDENQCSPGFFVSDNTPSLGQNFMNSLYTVYDIEREEIGLAFANNDAGLPNYANLADEYLATKAPGYLDPQPNSHYTAVSVTWLGVVNTEPPASGALESFYQTKDYTTIDVSSTVTPATSAMPTISSAASLNNPSKATLSSAPTLTSMTIATSSFVATISSKRSVNGAPSSSIQRSDDTRKHFSYSSGSQQFGGSSKISAINSNMIASALDPDNSGPESMIASFSPSSASDYSHSASSLPGATKVPFNKSLTSGTMVSSVSTPEGSKKLSKSLVPLTKTYKSAFHSPSAISLQSVMPSYLNTSVSTFPSTISRVPSNIISRATSIAPKTPTITEPRTNGFVSSTEITSATADATAHSKSILSTSDDSWSLPKIVSANADAAASSKAFLSQDENLVATTTISGQEVIETVQKNYTGYSTQTMVPWGYESVKSIVDPVPNPSPAYDTIKLTATAIASCSNTAKQELPPIGHNSLSASERSPYANLNSRGVRSVSGYSMGSGVKTSEANYVTSSSTAMNNMATQAPDGSHTTESSLTGGDTSSGRGSATASDIASIDITNQGNILVTGVGSLFLFAISILV